MHRATETHRIAASLGGLLQRTRRHVFRCGLLRLVAAAGLPLLAAVWVAGGGTRHWGVMAWGLSLSLATVWLALVWRLLIEPLRRYRSPRDLATAVERRGDFANVLVAAEEAQRRPDRWPDADPLARELHRRVDLGAARVIDLLQPGQIHPHRYNRLTGTGLALTLVAAAVFAVLAPADLQRGLIRLVTPALRQAPVPSRGLYAVAGAPFAVAGDTLRISAVDFGRGDDRAVCEVRFGQGGWQSLQVAGETPASASPGVPGPYRRWTAAVPDVRENIVWRFRRGSLASAERAVVIHHPPLLTGLAARLVPPAYTRLPARDLSRLPTWIEVPAGSRLELTGTANHPVKAAGVHIESGDTLTMRVDALRVRASWTVDAAAAFRIHLTDVFDLTNIDPLRYEVAAAADRPPEVVLRREGDDGILPLAGELRLAVEAADDYGLTRLALLARIVGSEGSQRPDESDQETTGDAWRRVAVWPAAGDAHLELMTSAGRLRGTSERMDDVESELTARFGLGLDAQALDLVPGDAIELAVEVEDNRRPGDPNRTRSRVLRLVLPSSSDVLTAQAEAQEHHRGELEEVRRHSGQLNADLDRLTRELMKNPLPDWARQQEMEAAIQRQRTMQEDLARVAEQLRQELEKLAAGQLTSEAQLERAEQMSQLLAQNPSESLQELLRKMEASAGRISPQEVSQAMNEVARQQKDMARRLDAALALLKRMAEEQELAGLTALLEKMIQKQQELADLSRELAERQAAEDANETAQGESPETPQGEPRDTSAGDPEHPPGGDEATADELARRQEALEQELEQLKERMEQALAELQQDETDPAAPNDASDQPQGQMEQALRQALEKVQQQQSEGNMDQASQMLEQMDPEQAAKLQEQSLRDLGSLYSVLLQSQQAMQTAMKMEQVSSLRGLAADLLALSVRQEEVAARIPPGLRDVRALNLTRDQHRLQKAAAGIRGRLADLMDEAPNRIMRLVNKMDDLIGVMGESVRALEENRAVAARERTRAGLADANRMVIGLLTEAQMTGSAGGGGGGSTPSLSEQLQDMARQQAGLNGATDELRRMLADRGISQEIRSRMQRLGEEQVGLAQQMEGLAEQERVQPEGERLLGDLGELGRDMERVGRDFDDGLVSEETLIRQERILSRMLDARNSVRRRDFSNKRESRAAAELYAEQQGRIGADADIENDPLQLRYQALENAPLEYRDLVRRYFAALDSLRRLDDAPPETEGRRLETP